MEGTRRGLGPGGTRGTIEPLCRGGGGGQIAALEIPSQGDTQKPSLNPQPGAETQFADCVCVCAGGRGGTEADSSACTGGRELSS
ncbi:unnamed protein product [Pleuronectes platessa]|uniref:Uncharacterized protein n=1 Tax=Pleuronectes platessa TaxID=8262 RepID=A0A9N7YBC3_PLEPL|nr:unnamed protein product [Pleuronectes platessa]